MRKIVLLLLVVAVFSCNNDEGLELIEHKTELKSRLKQKSKFNVLRIPINSSSFNYTLKKKDRKVNLKGYIVEKLTKYPIVLNYDLCLIKNKTEVLNNTNEDILIRLTNSKLNNRVIPSNLLISANSLLYKHILVKKGNKAILKKRRKFVKVTFKTLK